MKSVSIRKLINGPLSTSIIFQMLTDFELNSFTLSDVRNIIKIMIVIFHKLTVFFLYMSKNFHTL